MRKRHAVLLILILLLAGSGAAGYTLARGEPRLREAPEATEAVAAAGAARISQNATICWEYVYEMCAHTVTVETPADEAMAGMTFTQLQEKYPDARIVAFEAQRVALRMYFTCYCPEHYILREYQGELAIFRTKEGTDEPRVFRLIHMDFSEIEAGERAVLEVGRAFDSEEDAESYIADLGNQTADGPSAYNTS